MANSTTLTVRVRPELKASLGQLATDTRRTQSFLAAEAIEAFVTRELAIIEAIKLGQEDVSAGRVVTHEDAMARIDETIRRASLGLAAE